MRTTAFICALLAALLLLPSVASAASAWTWPVRGDVITEYRNGDDPYAAGQHRGIDIAAPAGSEVVAATAGTVVYAGVVGTSGLTVSQLTASGEHVVSYLHLASVAVRSGQEIAAGAPLGTVGVSGSRSVDEPHLHLGVRAAGDRHAYVDPLRFLAPPPADAPQPRPVPAPVPVTVPGFPAPAPAAAPVRAAAATPSAAPAPAAAPVPLGLSAPAASLSPEPDRALAAAPRSAARPVGAAATPATSLPAADDRPRPGATRERDGAGTPSRAHEPLTGPPAQRRAAAAPGPAPVVESRSVPARGRGGGFDLGWLAACVGLVAAAALLAGPRRDAARRGTGRAVFATLMRAASRG